MRIGFSSLENAASREEILARLASFDDGALRVLLDDWTIWAREDQLEPPAAAGGRRWRTWLMLGGRGAGKTRAGRGMGEGQVLGRRPHAARSELRIALVGETIKDVRR